MHFLSENRPTRAEIDLQAFDRNIQTIVTRLPEGSRLIAVLKADGYGHGAVELARRCAKLPVAALAVALLEEAIELRTAGIELPLLVFGALSEAQVRIAADRAITVGIPGPESLANAARVAKEREVRVHLKLDSGMGRMGLVEDDLADAVELIRATPNLKVEAIYSHFATADEDHPLTAEQRARFRTLLETLREAGFSAPLHHFANSAATLRGLVEPGDFVRAGIALYGAGVVSASGRPSAGGGPEAHTTPVMRWRTEIVRLKELPPGHAIGYGATFHTTRTSRIATLPVGYADGYNRLLSNRGEVLIRGRRAPIVGRVSMDLTTVDVTDIPEAVVGDEAVLLGDAIDVEELAAKLGTISYEVFCSVGARVPRVYFDGDRIISIRSRFV
jgi:alanine racemase